MWKLKEIVGKYQEIGTSDSQQTVMIGLRDSKTKLSTEVYVVRYFGETQVLSSTKPEIGHHVQLKVSWQHRNTLAGLNTGMHGEPGCVDSFLEKRLKRMTYEDLNPDNSISPSVRITVVEFR